MSKKTSNSDSTNTVESVTTILSISKKCKGSVRYDTMDKNNEKSLIAIYVLNDTVDKLGDPKKITVSIKAKT